MYQQQGAIELMATEHPTFSPTAVWLNQIELRAVIDCCDQVRLRDALPILCRNPEVYDRSKVSVDCFDALQSLRSLRKVGRLREAAQLELFPSAAQLVQVPTGFVYYPSSHVARVDPTENKKYHLGGALSDSLRSRECLSSPLAVSS